MEYLTKGIMRLSYEFLKAIAFLTVLPTTVFSATPEPTLVPEGCVKFIDGTLSYGCDGIHGALRRNNGYEEGCGKDYEHFLSRLKRKPLLASASSFCSTFISRLPVTKTATKVCCFPCTLMRQ